MYFLKYICKNAIEAIFQLVGEELFGTNGSGSGGSLTDEEREEQTERRQPDGWQFGKSLDNIEEGRVMLHLCLVSCLIVFGQTCRLFFCHQRNNTMMMFKATKNGRAREVD